MAFADDGSTWLPEGIVISCAAAPPPRPTSAPSSLPQSRSSVPTRTHHRRERKEDRILIESLRPEARGKTHLSLMASSHVERSLLSFPFRNAVQVRILPLSSIHCIFAFGEKNLFGAGTARLICMPFPFLPSSISRAARRAVPGVLVISGAPCFVPSSASLARAWYRRRF